MAGIVVTMAVAADRMVRIRIDDARIQRYLVSRLNDARSTFIRNMSLAETNPNAGRRRGEGWHFPSIPGGYPRTDTGRLANSVDFQIGEREGILFSDIEYAIFLATGTRNMAPRKMLEDALEEVMAARPETDMLANAVVIDD